MRWRFFPGRLVLMPASLPARASGSPRRCPSPPGSPIATLPGGGLCRRAAPGNPQPARLAHLADWAKTLPPRSLPRTVTPALGEYHLDYTVQLAEANHLEFRELTGALDDPAAIRHHPHDWRQYEQAPSRTLDRDEIAHNQ